MNTDKSNKKHVITALVENQPGVLARIVDLISGRGFNIDSLNVAPTQDPDVSRMTIQVPGDDRVLEQVNKQLNKLIDVIKVSDLTAERIVDRELVLVKVAVGVAQRAELIEVADMVKADIVAVQARSVILQMVGDNEQIENFMSLIKPFGVADLSRSGVIAVAREANGVGGKKA